MIKNLLFAGLISMISISVSAQCEDWVNPTPTTGWTDFGSLPCNGESHEITAFEVYQSEAYRLEGALVGGNYTFSVCNGSGAGAWVPEFTIIAPSGAIDAFGAGDGDGCSITWTASEEGTYLVVINEAGNCGVEGADNGGFPMISTNSGGADCLPPPVFVEGAESFEGSTDLPACWQAIDADGDGHNWSVQTGGGYPFEGTNAVASYSWDATDGDITPDNYLVTPRLDISEGDTLYYLVKAQDPAWPTETYSVLISTTGTQIADFADEAFTETLDFGAYQGRTVDLSAYAGNSIYIAFRHHSSTGMFSVALDGVLLPGVNCNPDAVTELEKVESSLFPNPATDNLNITSSLQGAATVRVYDAIGRVVLANNVNLSQATFTQNISSLENGIYTIQISTTDKVATQRFVKQ